MASPNPQQPNELEIEDRENSRQIKEYFIPGQHVSLPRLKEPIIQMIPENPMKKYIIKDIPPYPTPVEFWVSDVAHVTSKSGFKGIMMSEGFMPVQEEFSWWGLKINREEIREAERRYVDRHFPNQAQDLDPFLEKFTTSPPFNLKESRYGNYRFTFPLTDLMQWYKEQNCSGEEPVLRVYETTTYKQEIMYTVLIHSPEYNERFGEYPLLEPTSEWVRYQEGKIIWKAQAICETHRYEFVSGEVREFWNYQYYVWDHVSLVFHLPNRESLEIPRERLIKALDACKIYDKIDLSRYEVTKDKDERFEEAVIKISELKSQLEDSGLIQSDS